MQITMNLKGMTAALMLGALATAGAAIAQDNPNPSGQDKMFVTRAAQGGMAEVEMGQAAATHAQNEQIREFGQHMIEDHRAVNQELMELAMQQGIKPPAGMDQKHRQKLETLMKLSGARFDQQYITEQIRAHEQMILMFEQQVEQGQNEALTDFAQDTLPTLEEHLQMAQEVHANTAQRR